MRLNRLRRKRPNKQAVRGGGTPTPAPAPVAPFFELATGVTTYPPAYNVIDVADSFRSGDRLYLAIANNARFNGGDLLYYDLDGTEDSVGAEAVFTDGFGGTLADNTSGNTWAYAYIDRDGTLSAHSNTVIHGETEDALASWSFSTVTGVALSAVSSTGSVTPTGYNVGLAISVTGGEYRLDAGGGFGAWTSTAGTIYPSDILQHRHTNSASYLTDTVSSVTIGAVTQTFTTRTLADASNPVWNSADKAANITLSNGNLTATGVDAGGWMGVRATVSHADASTITYEFTLTDIKAGGSELYVGFCRAANGLTTANPGLTANPGAIMACGTWGWEIRNGSAGPDQTNYADPCADSDVIAAVLSGGVVQFKRNGTNKGTAITPPAGTGELFPVFFTTDGSAVTLDQV